MKYSKLLLAVSLILAVVALGAPALAQSAPTADVGGQLINRGGGGGGGGGLPAEDVGGEVLGREVTQAPAEGGGLPVTGANLILFVVVGAAAIAGGDLIRRRARRSKAKA